MLLDIVVVADHAREICRAFPIVVRAEIRADVVRTESLPLERRRAGRQRAATALSSAIGVRPLECRAGLVNPSQVVDAPVHRLVRLVRKKRWVWNGWDVGRVGGQRIVLPPPLSVAGPA